MALKRFVCGMVVLCGFVPAMAAAHEAHVHGVARMDIAVEGNRVEVALESPLANVLPFERAPATDVEKDQVRAMAGVLRDASSLFVFPAEASCTLVKVSLESEALDDDLLGAGAGGHKDAASGHEDDEGEEGHEHADMDAEFVFECRNPKALNGMNVKLFEAFAGMKEIEVQMVTPQGQKAAELTPQSTALNW